LSSVQEMTEASESIEEPSALYSEFVRRYINAAIKGNVGAQATLGYFYEIGEHVEADVRESIRWYEKAASNGHLQATLRLAELEIAAGNGKEGVSWFEKAAIQGDRDAQAMLGYFYQTGEHVTSDLDVAIKWYLAAADQDHIAAQNNLGRLYQIGEGVEKDLDQAIYWYERAANNGSEAAARNLQNLLP
jgi:tetratricopeptide (TPR) repeat protein